MEHRHAALVCDGSEREGFTIDGTLLRLERGMIPAEFVETAAPA
jgi:hypothetical protein